MSTKNEEKLKTDEKQIKESTPPTENVTETANIPTTGGKELDALVEQMPEVVPEAVEAAREELEQKQSNPHAHLKDRYGRSFDPSYHMTDSDGKPILTRDNNLRVIAGRKKTEKSDSVLNLPPEQRQIALSEEAHRKSVATFSASAFIQVGVAVFGDEWQPDPKEGEQENLISCFDDYYKATGVKDIPPGMALCIGLAGYGLKRFSRPKTKTKLQAFKDWAGVKITNLMYKMKYKKGPKNNARFNTGDNAKRENNSSVQTGGEVQGTKNAASGA